MYERSLSTLRGHAPALPLSLACAAGQAAVWFLSEEQIPIVLAVVGAALCWRSKRGGGFLMAGVIVGIVSAYLALMSHPMPQHLRVEREGGDPIMGRVVGIPRRPNPGAVIFELDSDQGRIRCRAIDLPWRNASRVEPGDAIFIRGEVKPVERPLNPFSWQAWLWRGGISAECKARFVSQALEADRPIVTSIREWTRHRVEDEVGDGRGESLFLSMALGYHDVLSEPVERAFKRLGLTHLLVVSGYQVSLVFGVVLSLCRFMSGSLPHISHLRVLVTAAALALACLYVLCIGAEMSAMRALIAAASLSAGILSETGSRFAQRWGVALLIMLLVWPWCFFEIGVILTFSALMGIGLGATLAGRRAGASFVWVTLCAWLSTTLVMVVWNGTFSPIGIVTNLVLAVPWSVINCALGLSALGLGLCGLAVGWEVLRGVSWLNLQISEQLIEIADLPGLSFELTGFNQIATALMLMAALTILGLRACNQFMRVTLLAPASIASSSHLCSQRFDRHHGPHM